MKTKPFMVAALCLLCLLLPALPLAAQEDDYLFIWKYGDDSACLLDLSSVRVEKNNLGNYVAGTVRVEYSDIGKEDYSYISPNVSYSRDLWYANIDARQVQIRGEWFYDENDNLLGIENAYAAEFKWSDCTPDGFGDILWQTLMEAAGL